MKEATLAHLFITLTVLAVVTGTYYFFFAHINWRVTQLVLSTHIVSGLALLPIAGAYLWRHLSKGMRIRLNWSFCITAWALFVLYALLLLSGLILVVPTILYFTGLVVFWSFAVSAALAWAHAGLAAAAVLLLVAHLISSPRPTPSAPRTQHDLTVTEEESHP